MYHRETQTVALSIGDAVIMLEWSPLYMACIIQGLGCV